MCNIFKSLYSHWHSLWLLALDAKPTFYYFDIFVLLLASLCSSLYMLFHFYCCSLHAFSSFFCSSFCLLFSSLSFSFSVIHLVLAALFLQMLALIHSVLVRTLALATSFSMLILSNSYRIDQFSLWWMLRHWYGFIELCVLDDFSDL